MSKVVGVDWAAWKGWSCVVKDEDGWSAEMQLSMLSVWYHHGDAERILADIPLGLPPEDRRACDKAAKEYLGSERQSSMFYTPCRKAVKALSYEREVGGQSLRGQGTSGRCRFSVEEESDDGRTTGTEQD